MLPRNTPPGTLVGYKLPSCSESYGTLVKIEGDHALVKHTNNTTTLVPLNRAWVD